MKLDQFPGVNAGYVLELYERYRQNPESVDPATREASRRGRPPMRAAPAPAARRAAPARPARHRRRRQPRRVDPPLRPPRRARSIRSARRRSAIRRCRPSAHGITDDDLQAAAGVARRRAGRRTRRPTPTRRSRSCARSTARRPASTIAHVFVPEEREWLREAAESGRFLPPMDPASADGAARPHHAGRGLRALPASHLPGQDALLGRRARHARADPRRDHLRRGRQRHRATRCIGMAHRGRLNVLAHVLAEAVRADPGRVQGSGRSADAARRPRLDGRREVPRRRAHRGAARADVRDDGAEPEPPRGGEPGGRRHGARRGHAWPTAPGAPRFDGAHARCRS